MSDGVTIIGAGGHAKVVISTLQAAGIPVAAALEDPVERRGSLLLGVPIEGPIAELPAGAGALIAVGDNRTRARLAGELEAEWTTAVHPRSWVAPEAVLGEGTVVFAGAVVQPGAHLGRHVIVNTGATIDHDCVLGDFVHVGPGAHLCGGVIIGEGALLGVGAAAIPGSRVGAWATVGAGAVVVGEVPAGATAIGAPARPREGDSW